MNYKTLPMIERAKLHATQAHESINHKRKYTDEPYIVHPKEVAELVSSVHSTDDEMIAAAWLHDVLEDVMPLNSKYNPLFIQASFGERVRYLVEALTDVSKPSDGNRQLRKAIDREHIANSHPDAKTIKLADLIDNTETIVKYDKGFAKIYLEEKELLLPILSDGNNRLWDKAWNTLCWAKEELKRTNDA